MWPDRSRYMMNSWWTEGEGRKEEGSGGSKQDFVSCAGIWQSQSDLKQSSFALYVTWFLHWACDHIRSRKVKTLEEINKTISFTVSHLGYMKLKPHLKLVKEFAQSREAFVSIPMGQKSLHALDVYHSTSKFSTSDTTSTALWQWCSLA